MSAQHWVKLLVGNDDTHQWRTVGAYRTVLAVVHNVTAATRLLDVLPLWSTDTRVQTVFTCIGSSAFTTGTSEFLAEHGVIPVPWEDAVHLEFDLVISASYGGPLHELPAPLVVVPHGMGYNKYLPETGNRKPETGNRKPETGNRKPVFGLSRPWLMHEGELVPSVVVLSHSEQLERLRGSCPEATDAALVAGDPCFDRMLASLPLRETYRRSLGAQPQQRLVMVSSTWGESALFGQDPSLVVRLARELPLDEYRVVVALHPNIWYGHSPWQIRAWLADCTRAGVVVLPPEEGWRAALVAADITIGDHGSVTFYSAALGTALLLAAGPEDAVDPASPIGRLLRLAPRLDRGKAFLPQIESAFQAHSAGQYADVTGLTTSEPGQSARLLRAEVYSWLRISEPPTPAEPTAVPIPETDRGSVYSQLVTVQLEADTADFSATVARHPAEVLHDAERVPAEAALVTSTAEPRRRWLELAEILLHDGPCDDIAHWARTSLAALPGCLLGAVRSPAGGWLVTGLDLPVVRFTGPEDLGPVYAGMLHAWLRAGHPVHGLPGRARIRLGRAEVMAGVEVLKARP